jgi:hypothetical protein
MRALQVRLNRGSTSCTARRGAAATWARHAIGLATPGRGDQLSTGRAIIGSCSHARKSRIFFPLSLPQACTLLTFSTGFSVVFEERSAATAAETPPPDPAFPMPRTTSPAAPPSCWPVGPPCCPAPPGPGVLVAPPPRSAARRALPKCGDGHGPESSAELLAPAHRALIASRSSTGMTVTAKGVPASSETWGSGLPNSFPPTIEFS